MKSYTFIDEDDLVCGYVSSIEKENIRRMVAYLKSSDKFKNKYIYDLNDDWKIINVPERDKSNNKWRNRDVLIEFSSNELHPIL
jgi:hypothetical protein